MPNLEAFEINAAAVSILKRRHRQSDPANAGEVRTSYDDALAALPFELITSAVRRHRSHWHTVRYSYGPQIGLWKQLEPFCDPATIRQLELWEITLSHSVPSPRLGFLAHLPHLKSLSLSFGFVDELPEVQKITNFIQQPGRRSLEIG